MEADNPLDFLHELKAEAAEQAAQAEPEPQADEPTPEAAPESPARDEKGRFTARQAAPEPDRGQADDEPVRVSALGGLLDEREKRQAAERRTRELEARISELESASREPIRPDPARDAEMHGLKLNFSRKSAEREHGKETIDKVHAWAFEKAAADPAFNQRMFTSIDPYEDAVKAWQTEQIQSQVSYADLEDFRAWQAARAAAAQSAPAPKPAPPEPPPPPRSRANAPGNGAVAREHVPTGEGEAFRAAFT